MQFRLAIAVDGPCGTTERDGENMGPAVTD